MCPSLFIDLQLRESLLCSIIYKVCLLPSWWYVANVCYIKYMLVYEVQQSWYALVIVVSWTAVIFSASVHVCTEMGGCKLLSRFLSAYLYIFVICWKQNMILSSCLSYFVCFVLCKNNASHKIPSLHELWIHESQTILIYRSTTISFKFEAIVYMLTIIFWDVLSFISELYHLIHWAG